MQLLRKRRVDEHVADDVLDDFVRVGQRCERAAKLFLEGPALDTWKRLVDAAESVGEAWSGSWLGYQASMYKVGLLPRSSSEHFDLEWGEFRTVLNRTDGEWAEYSYQTVYEQVFERAQVGSSVEFENAAKVAGRVFDESKREFIPTIDAVIADYRDSTLKRLRDQAEKLSSHMAASDFVKVRRPKQVMSRDMKAMQGGLQVPPHLAVHAWLLEQRSYAERVKELGQVVEHAAKYLEKRRKMKGRTVARTDGPVFIGHGRSADWRDLRDLLVDRLQFDYEEYSREATAGLSTKERLLEMLDRCCFAFIVMTAEDEQADGKVFARQNVVHEAGLFQGRYGFERAIILLEEGCEEFSNIHGIGQIRFLKGNLRGQSEEIRRVLERERITK